MALSDKEIGERIKHVRETCNLTQNNFAKKLHMTQQTLSRHENGKSTVPNDVLENIAQKFDVSLTYFLGIDSDKFSDDELLLVEFYRKVDARVKKNIFELVKVMAMDFKDEKSDHS